MEFIADPEEMVRRALAHIDKKRAELGLPAYDPQRYGHGGDRRVLELESLPLEERRKALYGNAFTGSR